MIHITEGISNYEFTIFQTIKNTFIIRVKIRTTHLPLGSSLILQLYLCKHIRNND